MADCPACEQATRLIATTLADVGASGGTPNAWELQLAERMVGALVEAGLMR